MKSLIKVMMIFFVTLTLFTSCKKGNELSKAELISKQPWILKAYTTTRLSDGVVSDAFGPISTCYKDDQYFFKADMTYEGSAGATKCSASDPQVFQTGTWKFTANETIVERMITTGFGIGTLAFKVVSLSATELKVSVEDGTFKHEISYSH